MQEAVSLTKSFYEEGCFFGIMCRPTVGRRNSSSLNRQEQAVHAKKAELRPGPFQTVYQGDGENVCLNQPIVAHRVPRNFGKAKQAGSQTKKRNLCAEASPEYYNCRSGPNARPHFHRGLRETTLFGFREVCGSAPHKTGRVFISSARRFQDLQGSDTESELYPVAVQACPVEVSLRSRQGRFPGLSRLGFYTEGSS
jgi:hypothetical protein